MKAPTQWGKWMYGQYVAAVVRRAMQPAKGAVEGAMLLAAIVSPMLAQFAGVDMPTADSILAYVGAAAVAYVTLRVFFVAPYQVWRDQVGQIGSLKLELSEPERKELAHMATIRAGKRLELAAALREYHWASYHGKKKSSQLYLKVITLMGQAGVTNSFTVGFTQFADHCIAVRTAAQSGGTRPKIGVDGSFALLERLIEFLHGRIDGEKLALALSQFPTEPELPMDMPALEPPTE